MRTAEEMINFVDEHSLGTGMNKKWRLKHFKVAAEQLNDDEEALACFIGIHNYISATKHDNYYAYVITKDRFIMAQKKIIGENLKIVTRKHLNDVSKSTGVVWGILAFDTFKEKFNVAIDKGTLNNVYTMVNKILFESDPQEQSVVINNHGEKSVAEQLKEFKELLDMEIISQEEFDVKKAELLG